MFYYDEPALSGMDKEIETVNNIISKVKYYLNKGIHVYFNVYRIIDIVDIQTEDDLYIDYRNGYGYNEPFLIIDSGVISLSSITSNDKFYIRECIS